METRIYRLSAICTAVTASAFVLPRFVPSSGDGGYAGAGIAILVFLGVLTLAAIWSLYLLLETIRAYREISIIPRLAGIVPSIVLVTAVAWLLGLLRY
jgi:hypothetical protein